MLALLTARLWPQTLLLTALFLLIMAAATMLACGPVERPAPADDSVLPAAQQSDGRGEPTEDPTETPALERYARDYTESSEKSGANSDPYSDMPTPPPDPTRRYPKLPHNLDRIAIEAEDSQGPSGQSDSPPEIHVVIGMTNNPDHPTTKALVQYLKEQGVTPVSVDPLAEGFGEGTHIEAFVPATMLGPITQHKGVAGILSTDHEQPDSRPEPDRLLP